MTTIDWSQMKTQEQLEEERNQAEYIAISRKAGLFWIYDNLHTTEEQILAGVEEIEDEGERYKARLSFNTAYWHSNDPYVIAFGAKLGLDTREKLLQAFEEASKL